MANIVKTSFLSSQGDVRATLKAVKSSQIHISQKNILGVDERVDIAYYGFKENIEDTQKSIYEALKLQLANVVENLSEENRKNTILLIGTSIIDWNIADAIEHKDDAYSSQKLSIDTYAKKLSEYFGLNGFTLTINTACTSSANALLEANNLINAGLYKYAVVLGCEFFSQIMASGFNAMQLLSNESIKPFDKERSGMILGEGIAAFLLSNESSPWKIKGGFSNCNGVNITAVSPQGEEFKEVMLGALKNASINADEVTLLKAHATATHSNDLSEINAITKVFKKSIKFTALKPYLGHTVGACGLLEMGLLMACIDDGFVPKTLNFKENEVNDYLPLIEDFSCFSGVFMMNYFGFGANNTSVIIEKKVC